MRTALNLDDDLLRAVRRLAKERGVSHGQIVSELVRKALPPQAAPSMRNSVPLFVTKPGACKPDLQLVNQLRDDA